MRELRRHVGGHISQRAERPRDGQVVAGSDERPRLGIEALEEGADERGLPDPARPGQGDRAIGRQEVVQMLLCRLPGR